MTAEWKRPNTAIRLLLVLLGIGLATHFALVGNLWIWQLYAAKLRPTDIGWRQASAVSKKRDSFLPAPSKTPYLAVGSSQTGAIYGLYADRHTDLTLFTVAAMSPFDFVTHFDQIRRLRPDTILLYLSDFDLARLPDRAALVLAPSQGASIVGLWRDLYRAGGGDELSSVMPELFVGEAFPEFKYRFVFRGIVDKAFNRLASRLGPPATEPEDYWPVEQRIRELRESISEEHIDFNLYFLRQFLTESVDAGSAIVILQGQYNPIAASSETRRISEVVSERVQALARDLHQVRYVPLSTFRGFVEQDYRDLSHVSPEAGYELVDDLMEFLRQPRAAPVT